MQGRRTPRQVASRVQKYFEKLKRFGVDIGNGGPVAMEDDEGRVDFFSLRRAGIEEGERSAGVVNDRRLDNDIHFCRGEQRKTGEAALLAITRFI